MRKTVRLTAAAMAAIIAASCVSFGAFAENSADIIESEPSIADEILGGWEVSGNSSSMSKNPQAKAAFEKATEGMTGVSYKAIAVLGTQVVAGMKYAILCRATPVYPDADSEMVVMYIYESLDGSAEITGFQTIIGEPEEGGFTANTGKTAIDKKRNKKIYSAYKKAMKGLEGVSYKPVAYLGSQVAAGSNYMILCRSQAAYPDAPYEWSLVTVNKSLKGKVKLLDIQTLELGSTDSEPDMGGNTQIPNPWQEYKTVAEAAKAAGVSFAAPDKLGDYTLSYVQAMDGIVEVRYEKDGKELSIRKGKGTDDISGDYNTYKNVTEKTINGVTVTLKGNAGGVASAVWTDGENAYAFCSEEEIPAMLFESAAAVIK